MPIGRERTRWRPVQAVQPTPPPDAAELAQARVDARFPGLLLGEGVMVLDRASVPLEHAFDLDFEQTTVTVPEGARLTVFGNYVRRGAFIAPTEE